MEKKFFSMGAFFAGLAVAAGAFGAHGLQKIVSAESLLIWDKAVRYQIYHAFALFVIAWAITQWWDQAKILSNAGWLFVLGILLFSGSLYAFVLTGTLKFGGVSMAYVTPLGGAAFVVGWLMLMVAARRAQKG
ncbi:MAG: DUF423 domain-containing protein [Anaerolineales bacterium]|nr:DUF423 domain-containing protein [Anaerolineales bacterium]